MDLRTASPPAAPGDQRSANRRDVDGTGYEHDPSWHRIPDTQWAAGHRNGADLWRRLKKQGFRGCARVVSEWASRRRRAEKADGALSRTPSARTVARLLTFERDNLSKAETITVAAIEGGVPRLVEAPRSSRLSRP